MNYRRLISEILPAIFFLNGLFGLNLSAQLSGPKTVLWEISGNGLPQASYLFGTIHIMPKKDFVLHKVVKEKLTASDQLIMEMDLNIPLSQKIEMAKAMMLPDKNTLKDYMDSLDYEHLRLYVLDSIGVKASRFNIYEKMKPFAFYSALIPELIGEKTESYELNFNKLAKKKKIPVYGLETLEYQMGIFDSIPIERQIDMFFDFTGNPRKEFDEMVEMYLSHDIYRMAASLSEDDKYKHFEKELITIRNHNWVEQFKVLLQEKPSFIAVGAGHLAGENGLLKLLEEAGFSVRPVMLNP